MDPNQEGPSENATCIFGIFHLGLSSRLYTLIYSNTLKTSMPTEKTNFFVSDLKYFINNINKKKIHLINIDNKNHKIDSIASITPEIDGYCAYQSIKKAANLVKKKKFSSIVTLPVNKKNTNLIEPSFFGHTEFFQKEWNEESVYMTFISKKMNVILLSTHIPLKDVYKHITLSKIDKILKAAIQLKQKLNIKKAAKIIHSGLYRAAALKSMPVSAPVATFCSPFSNGTMASSEP